MNSLKMLAHIAKGLGPLKDKVVFVGGSTVSLYLTDPGAATVRPTEDVDCVIQVLSRGHPRIDLKNINSLFQPVTPLSG